MAIYPSPNMQDSGVKNNRMNVLFSQAKRMEEMMFHQASSRVCHLIIFFNALESAKTSNFHP